MYPLPPTLFLRADDSHPGNRRQRRAAAAQHRRKARADMRARVRRFAKTRPRIVIRAFDNASKAAQKMADVFKEHAESFMAQLLAPSAIERAMQAGGIKVTELTPALERDLDLLGNAFYEETPTGKRRVDPTTVRRLSDDTWVIAGTNTPVKHLALKGLETPYGKPRWLAPAQHGDVREFNGVTYRYVTSEGEAAELDPNYVVRPPDS